MKINKYKEKGATLCLITYPGSLSIGLNEIKNVLLHGPSSSWSSQFLNRSRLSALRLIYVRLVGEIMPFLTLLDELLIVIASFITGKEVLVHFARVCMLSLALDVRG